MRNKSIEKMQALLKLIDRDEFIWLMCLVDAAWSAHRNRDAAILKYAAFGAEGNRMHAIGFSE